MHALLYLIKLTNIHTINISTQNCKIQSCLSYIYYILLNCKICYYAVYKYSVYVIKFVKTGHVGTNYTMSLNESHLHNKLQYFYYVNSIIILMPDKL